MSNITNNIQSNLTKFKSKINNISLNDITLRVEETTTKIQSSINIKSIKPKRIQEFSNSLFFSNKENCNTRNNNNNNNNNKYKNLNRVSAFITRHPSLSRKGLQAAAHASGDKETAKKNGQTNTKDIAETASRMNKASNFLVENQDAINDINKKMDKLNRGHDVSSSLNNKNMNSSAIANSGANPINNAMPLFIEPEAISNQGTPKITSRVQQQQQQQQPQQPQLPNNYQIMRNNSMTMVQSRNQITGGSKGAMLNRSKTVACHPMKVSTNIKFKKPPPPPTPNRQPDYLKMHEAIAATSTTTNTIGNATNTPSTTSTASNTTTSNVISSNINKTFVTPTSLSIRTSNAKLKRTGSDSNLSSAISTATATSASVLSAFTPGITFTPHSTHPLANNSSGNNNNQNRSIKNNTNINTITNTNNNIDKIQIKTMIDECSNEIQRIFNIQVPSENIFRYGHVFNQVTDGQLITDSMVKAIWIQSGAPRNILAKIWDYVNQKMEGLLERPEFVTGMYLIDQYLGGIDIDHYFNQQQQQQQQ
ncbi:hypothetical protein U3516DRAFT_548910 [Neocallimastix sp. 'constans']|jgi:hypothetical protein